MYLKDYVFGGNEEHDGIMIHKLYISNETMAEIVLKKLKKHELPRLEYLKNIDERLAIKLISDIFWELEIGEFEEMSGLFESYYTDEVDRYIRDEIENQGLENEYEIDELNI